VFHDGQAGATNRNRVTAICIRDNKRAFDGQAQSVSLALDGLYAAKFFNNSSEH
jgi:hypothetical protein